MSERITTTEVAKVASLARLRLTDEELELFTGQLGDILDHADDISSLDLNDVAPLVHAVALVNVFRVDEPGPTLSRDEVLANAPSAEDGQFRVPPVLGEEP